jgi:hypothetical protein
VLETRKYLWNDNIDMDEGQNYNERAASTPEGGPS